MAKAQPGIRVTIQLDPRVALESVLLNRHRQVPANRRQEWLRGLLVQGFRSEIESLRGTSDDTKRDSTMAFTKSMHRSPRQITGLPESAPAVAKAEPISVAEGTKPFAALGKVLG
ncbi:MAG: hypothetical protein AB2813_05440 [Candidatus Sedimenticola endophacoides]